MQILILTAEQTSARETHATIKGMSSYSMTIFDMQL